MPSLQERIDQIRPLCENIILEISRCAESEEITEKVLNRARAYLTMCMWYELLTVGQPEWIRVPMLTRIIRAPSESYHCACHWLASYSSERQLHDHFKQRHKEAARLYIEVKNSTNDPDQFSFPTNQFCNSKQVKELKIRLSKLMQLKKQLPACKEQREEWEKKRRMRDVYLRTKKA